MVDVNQQWDRTTALRMGRALEELELAWIEEPLDAHDLDGHAALAAQLVTRSVVARCSPVRPTPVPSSSAARWM